MDQQVEAALPACTGNQHGHGTARAPRRGVDRQASASEPRRRESQHHVQPGVQHGSHGPVVDHDDDLRQSALVRARELYGERVVTIERRHLCAAQDQATAPQVEHGRQRGHQFAAQQQGRLRAARQLGDERHLRRARFDLPQRAARQFDRVEPVPRHRSRAGAAARARRRQRLEAHPAGHFGREVDGAGPGVEQRRHAEPPLEHDLRHQELTGARDLVGQGCGVDSRRQHRHRIAGEQGRVQRQKAHRVELHAHGRLADQAFMAFRRQAQRAELPPVRVAHVALGHHFGVGEAVQARVVQVEVQLERGAAGRGDGEQLHHEAAGDRGRQAVGQRQRHLGTDAGAAGELVGFEPAQPVHERRLQRDARLGPGQQLALAALPRPPGVATVADPDQRCRGGPVGDFLPEGERRAADEGAVVQRLGIGMDGAFHDEVAGRGEGLAAAEKGDVAFDQLRDAGLLRGAGRGQQCCGAGGEGRAGSPAGGAPWCWHGTLIMHGCGVCRCARRRSQHSRGTVPSRARHRSPGAINPSRRRQPRWPRGHRDRGRSLPPRRPGSASPSSPPARAPSAG